MNKFKKNLLKISLISLVLATSMVFVPKVSAQTCPTACASSNVNCATTPGDVCCVDDPNSTTTPPGRINCAQVISVDRTAIGFQIPSFSEVLTFLIRFFFVLAGLTALIYMLWGAYDYVSSGGDDKKTGGAQKKITSAIIGVFLIVIALMLIVTLEQIIFKRTVCFGVSCPVQLPDLLKPCRDTVPGGDPCN